MSNVAVFVIFFWGGLAAQSIGSYLLKECCWKPKKGGTEVLPRLTNEDLAINVALS
jgi:hypothetical protein